MLSYINYNFENCSKFIQNMYPIMVKIIQLCNIDIVSIL
jgi:hypothetical protein